MKTLLLALCLCLSGCAYGMYDQPSGLFWVDQPFTQKMAQQNAQMWNQYYQNQQLWQMQQQNHILQYGW